MADYTFTDGNGNSYQLRNRQLTYHPIQTIESSSGIYSGGEPFEMELSEAMAERLIGLFDSAFRNRTFRLPKRTLGSAQIRRAADIEAGEEEDAVVILAMRSPEKGKIEALLAEIH